MVVVVEGMVMDMVKCHGHGHGRRRHGHGDGSHHRRSHRYLGRDRHG